jgi:hypothetical protein
MKVHLSEKKHNEEKNYKWIALKEKNTSNNTPWNGEKGGIGKFKNNDEDNEEDKEKRAKTSKGRKNTYLQVISFFQVWIKGSII